MEKIHIHTHFFTFVLIFEFSSAQLSKQNFNDPRRTFSCHFEHFLGVFQKFLAKYRIKTNLTEIFSWENLSAKYFEENLEKNREATFWPFWRIIVRKLIAWLYRFYQSLRSEKKSEHEEFQIMHAQRFPIIPNIPTWGIGSWPKWRKWGFSTRQKESGWIIDLELISWSVKTIIWPPKCISFSTSVLPAFRKPWRALEALISILSTVHSHRALGPLNLHLNVS